MSATSQYALYTKQPDRFLSLPETTMRKSSFKGKSGSPVQRRVARQDQARETVEFRLRLLLDSLGITLNA